MYQFNKQEVLKQLNTSQQGLSPQEAERRLKENGKNELDKAKRPSLIKSFFKQFLNIMVGILLVSAVVSITIAVTSHQYEDLFEGGVIFFIVIMNAIIGVYQENKAQACLDELQKYNKMSVKVRRGGTTLMIDSTEVVVGDIVEIDAGNVVCADIRLLDSNNLYCDESSLTGESVPVEKTAEITLKPNTQLADRINMLHSGSMVTNGKGLGVVVKTGRNTEIGKIANILFNTKKEITPLQKSIDKIGKIITYAVLAICAVIMLMELLNGQNINRALMTSVSLAVAAIPESLPAVITIIMALGIQQLAKRKCIIKHLHAVETLGSCEIICSDKTGTLTQNKMEVVDTFPNRIIDRLQKCMKYCNNAEIKNGKVIGEPTESAILNFIEKFDVPHAKKIHEIPFDSTRKMMSVWVNDDGLVSYTKGAPERILNKCKFIDFGGKIEPITSEIRKNIKQENEKMASKALRVIAFAYKKLDQNISIETEEEMIFLGLCGMQDNPRPEVKQAIVNCFKAGLKPVMITGDHKKTAFAIASQLGIAKFEKEVITGEELDALTDKELSKKCHEFSVYARVSPEHKVRIVKAYKKLNKVVAMTGDGVNDAPSLKIADIGVGMGKSGTDVVKSVADMVVTDDNFASIIVAVEEGRKVYSNIQKALQFLISTNCVEVFGMLLALLFFPNITFLLPAQMLFINLVTDSLPGFALGVENVEPEVMASPPRNSKAGLFGGKVGVVIIYQSILQTAIVMVVFMIGMFCYSPAVASTMVFFTIIFMQTLHSINCKSNSSLIGRKLLDNKTFNFCFVLTMLINLSVACIPFMYTIFGLEFLNFSQWLIVIIASIIILPTCELFKLVLDKDNKLHKLKISTKAQKGLEELKR